MSHECERCGATYYIDSPDLEPTPLCNTCAQDIATRLWMTCRSETWVRPELLEELARICMDSKGEE